MLQKMTQRVSLASEILSLHKTLNLLLVFEHIFKISLSNINWLSVVFPKNFLAKPHIYLFGPTDLPIYDQI